VAATRVAYEVESWGVGELWIADGRVVWHELPRPRAAAAAADGRRLSARPSTPSRTPARPRGARSIGRNGARDPDDFVNFVLAAIASYLDGERDTLDDVPVDLEYESEFHECCAHALRSVPRGQVVTYGELAALAGAPGAARAAGSFCARNRLGLFVPCHRVVGVGGLGSYGSLGLAYKRRLLALEGAAVAL
jgi:methylated-DNA-[protein]-cysteine S-methyltransferase